MFFSYSRDDTFSPLEEGFTPKAVSRKLRFSRVDSSEEDGSLVVLGHISDKKFAKTKGESFKDQDEASKDQDEESKDQDEIGDDPFQM